jgi:hypothetical protein
MWWCFVAQIRIWLSLIFVESSFLFLGSSFLVVMAVGIVIWGVVVWSRRREMGMELHGGGGTRDGGGEDGDN